MKKQIHTENKIGIWLDQETACLFKPGKEDEMPVYKIKSGVESRIRYAGEEKVSARFGQAYISDQEKKQRRQRHQRHEFFKEIVRLLHDTDFIYVFGPGKAKHELNNVIEAEHGFKGKVAAIENADRLTRKQMQRQTESFFDGEVFRDFKKGLKKQKVSG